MLNTAAPTPTPKDVVNGTEAVTLRGTTCIKDAVLASLLFVVSTFKRSIFLIIASFAFSGTSRKIFFTFCSFSSVVVSSVGDVVDGEEDETISFSFSTVVFSLSVLLVITIVVIFARSIILYPTSASPTFPSKSLTINSSPTCKVLRVPNPFNRTISGIDIPFSLETIDKVCCGWTFTMIFFLLTTLLLFVVDEVDEDDDAVARGVTHKVVVRRKVALLLLFCEEIRVA
mmetsp:Transcript_9280/g.29869  ORF Transcript_9280/g.29869 Transcript_9280/m.29869 type:complete len:229 (-) Transcript_9280:97-783(-)